jgi:hypothetical protein
MRKHKYLLLILTLVAVLVVDSWARRSVVAWLSDSLALVLALAVVLVVFERRWERVVACLAAVAALVFSFSRYLPIPTSLLETQAVVHHVLMAGFLGFGVAIILRNIFETKAITGDEVLGTVCGYILAAGAWANVYTAIAIVAPDSFSVPDTLKGFSDSAGRRALFNYFSVVTLTTMGYGDITPTRPPATAFAMLEAIFGQFYIAIVVAQLVGLRLAQALAPDDQAEP